MPNAVGARGAEAPVALQARGVFDTRVAIGLPSNRHEHRRRAGPLHGGVRQAGRHLPPQVHQPAKNRLPQVHRAGSRQRGEVHQRARNREVAGAARDARRPAGRGPRAPIIAGTSATATEKTPGAIGGGGVADGRYLPSAWLSQPGRGTRRRWW